MKAKLSRSLYLSCAAALASVLTLASSHGALSIDTASREKSRVFYNTIYPESEGVPSGWTGNVATGVAGTTSEAFKRAVILRVNMFRAYSGIPAGITHYLTWDGMDQSAALMMSANNTLSHTPGTNWRFYSVGGATAAGKSNLALGSYGPQSINNYMEDAGSINTVAGHRRWILYPQTRQMGTGDIVASGAYNSANALWVQDTAHLSDVRPAVRDAFVAWPPKGYVPYQLVYPRWSFAYPGANFSQSAVSMTLNGVAIPVAIQSRTNGYGENTLVFVPNNLNPDAWTGPVKPTSDLSYVVKVSNVVISGLAKSFTYTVRSFDPARLGSDTPPYLISGSSTPKVGVYKTYTVPAQVLATGYQWKSSTKAPFTTLTGAEVLNEVDAKVPTGLLLRDATVKYAGLYSYHLANPNFAESSFTLKYPVFCNSTSALTFYSRLGYATTSQSAIVEVSVDNGKQWAPIWTQKGNNGAGSASFATRSISLAAFNGREIKVRFRYAVGAGSAYTQTSAGMGWYVDNVAFTAAHKLVGSAVSSVAPTPSFSFKPTVAQPYVLQVRAVVLGSYAREWSVAKSVTAVP